jgi:hypothetical protein
MARVVFTSNLQRHVHCPEVEVAGRTVREVLDTIFADNVHARSYVLDDQAQLRKHMAIIVDGHPLRDRVSLSDAVGQNSEIFVLQALSGG